MRIGVLGVGRIGAAHADVVARHPGVTSVVVADADPARAAVVADKLGAEAATGVEEVVAAGVDGLVVATATAAHAGLIRAGIAAGLPVFCEKPVAADVAGTVEVLEAVRDSGVPVQVGFQRRFDHGYRAAKQALESGELGELHRIHAVTCDREPPALEFIPTSGGIFRDCLIHDFDILRWVTSREVVDVITLGANRGDETFAASDDVDNTVCLLTLDDGTLVTVHGSRYNGGGYDVRMELAGSRATYAVGLDDHAPLRSAEPGVAFPAGPPHPNFWERFAPAYEAEINAFVSVVQGQLPSPCTVEEALEALYVAEAATLSRQVGRRVSIEEVRT